MHCYIRKFKCVCVMLGEHISVPYSTEWNVKLKHLWNAGWRSCTDTVPVHANKPWIFKSNANENAWQTRLLAGNLIICVLACKWVYFLYLVCSLPLSLVLSLYNSPHFQRLFWLLFWIQAVLECQWNSTPNLNSTYTAPWTLFTCLIDDKNPASVVKYTVIACQASFSSTSRVTQKYCNKY